MYRKRIRSALFVVAILLGSSCNDFLPEDSIEGLTNKVGTALPSIEAIEYRTANISSVVFNAEEKVISGHGFCWSTSSSPEISDEFIDLGSLGNSSGFSSQITELQPNTRYYVRGWVSFNSLILYGEETSFTTKELELPQVATNAVDLMLNKATLGGEVLSDGGADIIELGFSLGTEENPTIDDQKLLASEESFFSLAQDLSSQTTYFFRAYAINEVGIAYGAQLSFVTESFVEDPDGEAYPTREINGRIWMVKNLNYEVTGSFCYNNISSNCDQYGRLYTLEAAQTACARLGSGWRLPTLSDWKSLPAAYLDITSGDIFGDPEQSLMDLKKGGAIGFDLEFGGSRGGDGSFSGIGSRSFYWTDTESSVGSDYKWVYNFSGSETSLTPGFISDEYAISCRCVISL